MKKLIVTISLSESMESDFMNLGPYFGFEVVKLDFQRVLNDQIDHTKCSNYSKVFIVLNVDETPYEMYKLAAELKAERDAEVYFISKNTDPDEHVRWFTLGACNYFIEPCKAEEVLRYAKQVSRKRDFIIADNNFKIDLKSQVVYYRGEEIEIADSTIKLIIYLIEHRDMVISRDELMDNVYYRERYNSERNVDTQIKNLRQATNFDVISTIRGQGYIYH